MIFVGGGENWTFESDNIESLEVRFFPFPRVDGFLFSFFFFCLYFFFIIVDCLCAKE